LDVSAYILQKQGPMTAMKLQKLCYYSKAWHLVWDSAALFPEDFEAWANGPVCRKLYASHRGQFGVTSEPRGDADALTDPEKQSIDVVLQTYGEFTAYQLSSLTHREDPWKDARGDLPAGARSDRTIDDASMAEYYEALVR
jgi:uncharacterized phage-associated protein